MVDFCFVGEVAKLVEEHPQVKSWANLADKLDLKSAVSETGKDKLVFFVGEKDLSQVEDQFNELAPLEQQKLTIICLHSGTIDDYANTFREFPSLNCIIPQSSDMTLNCIEKLSDSESRKKFTDNPSTFLLPADLERHESHNLIRSSDCKKCYDQLYDYMDEVRCFDGFADIVVTAASELLTNAFYNGKRDEKTGEAIIPDRQVDFALTGDEKVTFQFGISDNYFWLIVEDSFGTLDRPTLARALARAANEKTPVMDKPGGAGLGLMMLFDWSSEMSFFLKPKQHTMVACKFKLTRRQKEFHNESSALHIFDI